MAIKLGPILKFCGSDNIVWKISVLLVSEGSDETPAVNIESGGARMDIKPRLLKSWPDAAQPKYRVWKYEIDVPQAASAQQVSYNVNQVKYEFSVPAKNAPPVSAYGSCNGFSDPKLMKRISDKNALWKKMKERHGICHYNLLLLGGDQIYSDSMWELLDSLKAWTELNGDARNKAAFSDGMKAEVDSFFIETYIARWSQPEVAEMMSSIPTVMMWDDHDIFDGWGSYPAEQQSSSVYQGIFKIAREYFQLFQLQSNTDHPAATILSKQDNFSYAFRVGPYGVLVLDLRSERTATQVMSLQSWGEVYGWLDKQQDCKHMLVMSSIPVVHPDFSTLEALLCALPGQQELQDDLQDHWRSRSHQQERLRFIQRLLGWSTAKTGGRATILSGDVHVGAWGIIDAPVTDTRPNARVMNQLTSSGIVHPPPPAIALFYLERMADRTEKLPAGITTTMSKIPGASGCYIGARNYLSLEPDDAPSGGNRLWANWWVEGETIAYTQTIDPV